MHHIAVFRFSLCAFLNIFCMLRVVSKMRHMACNIQHHRSNNNFAMHVFLVLHFVQFGFDCTAIPLLCQTSTAKTEAYAISGGELFYSMLMTVHVISCQPSCHSCFHVAVSFKFVTTKFCLGARDRM